MSAPLLGSRSTCAERLVFPTLFKNTLKDRNMDLSAVMNIESINEF